MVAVLISVSVPGFVFAAMAQLAIVQINQWRGEQWLPVAGWGTLAHVWAPALMLGLGTMAYLTRLMRGSLIDIDNQPLSAGGAGAGLPPWRCFVRYQLRNALLPALSVMGPTITSITTGGSWSSRCLPFRDWAAISFRLWRNSDYTVIMGTTVFTVPFWSLWSWSLTCCMAGQTHEFGYRGRCHEG